MCGFDKAKTIIQYRVHESEEIAARGDYTQAKHSETLSVDMRPPGYRLAALCKCVLNPDEFDNYLLWELAYNELHYTKALDKLDFKYGLDRGKKQVLLYESLDDAVNYFACWPDLKDVFYAVNHLFANFEFKNILMRCANSPENKIQLGQFLDALLANNSPSNRNNPPPENNSGNESGNNNTRLNSNNPSLLPGYVGNQINFRSSSCSLMLKLLAGLIATVGITAVILAFTVFAPLITSATIVVGALGAAAILTSVGLFAKACRMSPPTLPPISVPPTKSKLSPI
jgi:hypothetical protein